MSFLILLLHIRGDNVTQIVILRKLHEISKMLGVLDDIIRINLKKVFEINPFTNI